SLTVRISIFLALAIASSFASRGILPVCRASSLSPNLRRLEQRSGFSAAPGGGRLHELRRRARVDGHQRRLQPLQPRFHPHLLLLGPLPRLGLEGQLLLLQLEVLVA